MNTGFLGLEREPELKSLKSARKSSDLLWSTCTLVLTHSHKSRRLMTETCCVLRRKGAHGQYKDRFCINRMEVLSESYLEWRV